MNIEPNASGLAESVRKGKDEDEAKEDKRTAI